MNNTRELLMAQMESVSDDIREYARQIESGKHGNRWTVTDEDGNEYGTLADDERKAHENAVESADTGLTGDPGNWEVERDEFDEPTIVDEYGNESPISERPLAVVDERGRQFVVVISTGGPHIEVTADRNQRAYLAGYWGGEKATLHGDHFDTFLDYFVGNHKRGKEK